MFYFSYPGSRGRLPVFHRHGNVRQRLNFHSERQRQGGPVSIYQRCRNLWNSPNTTRSLTGCSFRGDLNTITADPAFPKPEAPTSGLVNRITNYPEIIRILNKLNKFIWRKNVVHISWDQENSCWCNETQEHPWHFNMSLYLDGSVKELRCHMVISY